MSARLWKAEDLRELQRICHYLGREQFLRAIVEVLYRASDDTEDLEDKRISEGYQEAAWMLREAIETQEGVMP